MACAGSARRHGNLGAKGDRLRAPDAAWLGRLEVLAQGRWQPTVLKTPAPEASLLQWQRSGQTVGQLWLEDGAALWCGATPPCQRAPMQPQALRALVTELAR